jgi:hypothetical protein
MGLDIRIPIGMLFTTFGVLLVIYGLLSNSEIYQRSLGINVNLWVGIWLLVFGVFMWILGRRGSKATKGLPTEQVDTSRPRH